MGKKICYRLYAMRLSQENLAAAENERFYMVSPTHILIYRKPWRNAPDGAVVIGDDVNLSSAEESWLLDCNLTLMREFAQSHEKQNIERMSGFVDRFQAELEKEKKKLQEQGETA